MHRPRDANTHTPSTSRHHTYVSTNIHAHLQPPCNQIPTQNTHILRKLGRIFNTFCVLYFALALACACTLPSSHTKEVCVVIQLHNVRSYTRDRPMVRFGGFAPRRPPPGDDGYDQTLGFQGQDLLTLWLLAYIYTTGPCGDPACACGGPNDGQIGLGSACSCNTEGDGPKYRGLCAMCGASGRNATFSTPSVHVSTLFGDDQLGDLDYYSDKNSQMCRTCRERQLSPINRPSAAKVVKPRMTSKKLSQVEAKVGPAVFTRAKSDLSPNSFHKYAHQALQPIYTMPTGNIVISLNFLFSLFLAFSCHDASTVLASTTPALFLVANRALSQTHSNTGPQARPMLHLAAVLSSCGRSKDRGGPSLSHTAAYNVAVNIPSAPSPSAAVSPNTCRQWERVMT